MGVLADALRVMRVACGVFFTAKVTSPWAVTSPPAAHLRPLVAPEAECLAHFHILVEGAPCWVALPGRAPIAMAPGDLVILPQGEQHVMASDLAVAPVPVEQTLRIIPSGYVVPSACAKAGVLAMTRSLAVEWARHRIRLNAIAPGPFPTEGAWSRLMPSKEYEDHAKRYHPMKRFGRHDELANLAVYLVSDFSEYVNGECVTIDGGLWFRGAGEFNDLSELPDAVWEMMESARKKS